MIMPCKDCAKRHVGCHSECEDYKNAKLELSAINANRNKENVRRQSDMEHFRRITRRRR